jgi:limonene-1,2-epoxide hydrolase
MTCDNASIVREFIAAWSTLDADRLAGYFCEDGCYHNMPLEPVSGRDNIRDFIRGFLATWTATEWEIISIVAAGGIVVAERMDRTRTTTGSVDLPCVGVFEMERGKIKMWRDYFDMATYANAMRA